MRVNRRHFIFGSLAISLSVYYLNKVDFVNLFSKENELPEMLNHFDSSQISLTVMSNWHLTSKDIEHIQASRKFN
jgi:hypothetical protein